MTSDLFVVASVAGLAVVLVGYRVRAFDAALWLFASIVGQAAALQLIDAGPSVSYQHVRPLSELLSSRFVLPLALITAQLIAVLVWLWRLRHRLDAATFGGSWRLRPWQWSALLIAIFMTSATLSREPSLYVQELVVSTLLELLTLATIVAFALAIPRPLIAAFQARLGNLFGETERTQAGSRKGIDPVFVWGALWVIGLAIVLSVFVYQRHPHVPDEVGYLYHARYFAQGLLSMPAPPVPAAFDIDLMIYEPERWYSPVPPGWPAMLALGVLAGVPWLVNPLLAGLNVILSGLLLQGIYDRRVARVGVLLLCASPWHLFMAMNFMNHTFSFTCLLVAALAVHKIRETGKAWFGFPGGIALALISLTRPLEGLAIAIALGIWTLPLKGNRLRLAPAVMLTLVTVVVGASHLAYNAVLTGDPAVFPLMRYFDDVYRPGVNALGFGADRGLEDWPHDPFPGHGLRDVVANANLNITATNVELFGWGAGSLFPIFFLLVIGGVQKRDYPLLGMILMIVGLQSLYWFGGGPDFGARYWFAVLLPCIVLSIRGLDQLAQRFDRPSMAGTRVALGIGALIFAGLVTFLPWRATDKYFHYRGMVPDIRELSKSASFGRSIVFIRGDRAPDYASAAIYNPLDLQADAPVFVWDRSVEVRRQVLAAYPDRTVWFVDGPTRTRDGFRVVGGPMTVAEATTAQ